jgi:hypothetical protein
VKVDDQPLLYLQANASRCGENQCLDVSAEQLLQKLPTAKTIIAELPIYNFGAFQYRFSTSGFPF